MSKHLDGLDPAFRAAVEATIAECAAAGLIMSPYVGARSPAEQARLWRRSRSTSEIMSAVGTLRAAGAAWLAGVLDGVGAQATGPEVTRALPGLSWHQHGLAVDCVPLVGGKAVWDDARLWTIYRAAAKRHGLFPASVRQPAFDRPHVQARADSPQAATTWRQIDAAMQARWGAAP